LSLYLRDGSTPTSPAPGLPFFESISDSLLHICSSQIVEAMTDPILTANSNKGLFSMSFRAFSACRPSGHLILFYFLGFCLFFRGSLTFFRIFFSGLFNIFRIFRSLEHFSTFPGLFNFFRFFRLFNIFPTFPLSYSVHKRSIMVPLASG